MKDWIGNKNSIYKTLGASNHTDKDREQHDYYATDPKAAELLLEFKTLKYMKNLIKWMKALRLYFVMRSCSYWYRESTNEWIYEINIDIPNEYNCTSRYPHKYKHLCWFNWIKYFWSCVSDLRNYA